jgi:para-nitrobenzyl esterase
MRLWGSIVVLGALCSVAVMSGTASAYSQTGVSGPVRTFSGPVSGTTSSDGKISIFRGIPFAVPPVGDLRWTAPQPVKPWKSVLKADQFGASCMQQLQRSRLPWAKEFMAQNDDSEDCLTLNVWTPSLTRDKKLPVFVWIHGGGFAEGSSEIPVYEGTELARTGMVVVTINYRLGVFGFLAHPELTAESPHHSSGNYGLEDQVAALEWVKKNIQAFGGDPDNVTICGQSAGAASIHALVATPLAKGLFQRGIAQSGSGVTGFPQATLAQGEKRGVEFATSIGAHSLKDLRALSSEALLTTQTKGGGSISRFPMVVDGWFYPEDPNQIVAEGKQNDVPFITGMMENDSRSLGGPPLKADDFRKQVAKRYGAMAEEFLKLYPAGSDEEADKAQLESGRDRGKVSMYLWATRRAKTAKTLAYTYYFTQALPDPAHPEFGAFHTGEVPYLFRNLAIFDRPFKPVDHQVSDIISGYWKNFAQAGDPNGGDLPKWTSVSADSATTMEIGAHTGPIPLASPEKIRFWTNYFDSPISKNAPFF